MPISSHFSAAVLHLTRWSQGDFTSEPRDSSCHGSLFVYKNTIVKVCLSDVQVPLMVYYPDLEVLTSNLFSTGASASGSRRKWSFRRSEPLNQVEAARTPCDPEQGHSKTPISSSTDESTQKSASKCHKDAFEETTLRILPKLTVCVRQKKIL